MKKCSFFLKRKEKFVICNSFQSDCQGSLTLWKVGKSAKFLSMTVMINTLLYLKNDSGMKKLLGKIISLCEEYYFSKCLSTSTELEAKS